MFESNAIQSALFEKTGSDSANEERLKAIRGESELLCESIEHGLIAIGKMMEHLGCFADNESQDFSNQALDNQTASRLGALIGANAYLLNCLRNTSSNASFFLNGGYKGAK